MPVEDIYENMIKADEKNAPEYKRKKCPNCGKMNDAMNTECYWCDYEFAEE